MKQYADEEIGGQTYTKKILELSADARLEDCEDQIVFLK